MKNNPKRDRPQVLLVGNGIDICGSYYGGKFVKGNNFKTKDIIEMFCKKKSIPTVPDNISNLPFPLQFEQVSGGEKTERTGKFSKETKEKLIETLTQLSESKNNEHLDIPGKLLELDSDAILTTNYTYTLEKKLCSAFDKKKASEFRCYTLNDKDRCGETGYLMHTFYDMKNKNDNPRQIWHIHGEIYKPDSIILGHYGYFKLIGKILEKPKKVAKSPDNDDLGKPKSWPDLFIDSDLYVLGYSFDIAEIDLWGLLSRKRNANNPGSVVFYELPNPEEKLQRAKWDLLRSKNVEIEHCGFVFDRKPTDEAYFSFHCTAKWDLMRSINVKIEDCAFVSDIKPTDEDYYNFYCKAIEDIKRRIEEK